MQVQLGDALDKIMFVHPHEFVFLQRLEEVLQYAQCFRRYSRKTYVLGVEELHGLGLVTSQPIENVGQLLIMDLW